MGTAQDQMQSDLNRIRVRPSTALGHWAVMKQFFQSLFIAAREAFANWRATPPDKQKLAAINSGIRNRLEEIEASGMRVSAPDDPRSDSPVTLKQWTRWYLAEFQNACHENRDSQSPERWAETEKLFKELFRVAGQDFEREKLEEKLKAAQVTFDMKFAGAPKQEKQEMQKLLDEQFAEARNLLAKRLAEEQNPDGSEKTDGEAHNPVVSFTGRLSGLRERTGKIARTGTDDSTSRAVTGRRQA